MQTRPSDGAAERYFGLYPAIVTNVVDERKLGRVEVKFPFLGKDGEKVRAWATLVSPYAEKDQGFMVLPAKDTQVVVAFEAGVLRRPYVVGACWNGVETLPAEAQAPNDKRLMKTRSGSLLEFDDKQGASKVTLSMKSGHKLVFDDGTQEVLLTHKNGASIKIDAGGKVSIKGNSSVDITAPTLNVHAGTANFDGLVNCTTLTAKTAVSSPLYTTGGGNVW